MLFGVFPHPDCYIQVVNINFGWMSTNVSQVKPRYKDTKWLKSVPCQTEHVSIYVSIWRSVRHRRWRYKANNNVWPLETNCFIYLMMKPQNSLATYWHIDHLEKRFWKITLDSTLIFKSCRPWPHKSLSMTNFQAMIFGQKRCSKFLVILPTFHGNDTLTP